MIKELKNIVLTAGIVFWLSSFFIASPGYDGFFGLDEFCDGFLYMNGPISDPSLLISNLILEIAWLSNFTLIMFYPPMLRFRWIAMIMPWLAIFINSFKVANGILNPYISYSVRSFLPFYFWSAGISLFHLSFYMRGDFRESIKTVDKP